MNIYRSLIMLSIGFILSSCTQGSSEKTVGLSSLVADMEHLKGKAEYLHKPFLTAGDRVYMAGLQNGYFEDYGFHVPGEMAGIWNHPIKLMDGFSAKITQVGEGVEYCLTKADQFVNLPLANKHYYSVDQLGLDIERFQFVPDGVEGMVVAYTLENTTQEAIELTFHFTGWVDLSPVWLAERQNIENKEDVAKYEDEFGGIIANDAGNPWFTVFASNIMPTGSDIAPALCQDPRKDPNRGINASLKYAMTIDAGTAVELPFFIAGSYQSLDAAMNSFRDMKNNASQMLLDKKARYEEIQQTAQIDIPDKAIQEMYEWTKYNTDWLIRDVPEVGRGLSAGMPEYPWWFGCDATYALQGVLATGNVALAKETLNLLFDLSEKTNGNGRFVHEVSSNGVVFNPGNIQETPHFIMMLWTYYNWTGDQETFDKMYPSVKKGLDWLVNEADKDGNGYPDGVGIMEIPGLHAELIDVVVYTQQAFEVASKMALLKEEESLAKQYAERAEALKKRINTEWWVEDMNSYADFVGSTEEALPLVEAAITRVDTLGRDWAVQELKATKARLQKLSKHHKQGHVVYHNWIVSLPMEVGIAPKEKALKALQAAEPFANEYGLYVTGIDSDRDTEGKGSFADKKEGEDFSYTGTVMTIPTGVQAVAETQYGRTDKAVEYLHKLSNSFSYALPGSMFEVSPDYGCFAQAWNIYATAKPIITHVFGVHPQAHQKKLNIAPNIPSGWKQFSLSQLPISDNMIEKLSVKVDDKTITYIIGLADVTSWEVMFDTGRADHPVIIVNGEELKNMPFKLVDKKTEVVVQL